MRHALGLLAMAALGVAAWVGKLPMPALMLYGFMSIVSFALYRADKRTANEGGWRTPENTLHAVDLLGGWPGGLLAQGVFRHKTRKASFQVGFWMAVIANCGVMGWLLRTG